MVFPSHSSIHNVHLRTDANFVAGQKVHVSGVLRSNPLRTNDGKTITSSVVKALQLFVLDNECGSSTATGGDLNYVKLLANIASDVTTKTDHCTFSLATHFKIKYGIALI